MVNPKSPLIESRDAENMESENFQTILDMARRQGLRLDPKPEQVARIDRYVELLERWNRRINLTGDRTRLYSRHILDCLMLEIHPWPMETGAVIDIGSGAGLPGLVVAILHPSFHVDSLDTAAKKISFQQAAAAELGLENFFPRRMDIRRWSQSPEGEGRYDVVLARAFAPLHRLLKLGVGLLRAGGELRLHKGQGLEREQAELAANLPDHYEPHPEVFRYDFPEAGSGGTIVTYRRSGGGVIAV